MGSVKVSVDTLRKGDTSCDPIKAAAVAALKGIIEPLLELMLDAGITVQEFNKTVRERAVRVATRRVVKEIGRENRSRVSIITGLSRSEVTKILTAKESGTKLTSIQHPARRVIAAWYDNPQFGTPSGEPAILSIFGKRQSLERLVSTYGPGIPVRAMLDELLQMDAVERLADQKLKVKARVPILTGLTGRSITAIGERAKDLLDTLTHNLKETSHPLFEATAVVNDADPEMVSLIRREVAKQGTNFINNATSLLNRSQQRRAPRPTSASKPVRLGVTVYFFQEAISRRETITSSSVNSRRKNLRRHKKTFDNVGD